MSIDHGLLNDLYRTYLPEECRSIERKQSCFAFPIRVFILRRCFFLFRFTFQTFIRTSSKFSNGKLTFEGVSVQVLLSLTGQYSGLQPGH